MKYVSNSAFFVIGPVFIVAADFIATRFSTTSSKATSLGARKQSQSLFLNHGYGTKFYNTNFRSFPKSKD